MKRSEMLRNQERKGMRLQAATKKENQLIVLFLFYIFYFHEKRLGILFDKFMRQEVALRFYCKQEQFLS